ncbi:hypothetical protein ASF22_04880 [Methylobacterium sp. Leaf87]|nr:hypothetical protein ASF22_04880 [Methylobacterium sp. Leaf87]
MPLPFSVTARVPELLTVMPSYRVPFGALELAPYIRVVVLPAGAFRVMMPELFRVERSPARSTP